MTTGGGVGGVDLAEVRRAVRAEVTPARWRHIRGTVLTARYLAQRHGLDRRAAMLAAWLHDAARDWPLERMLAQPMPGWLAELRDLYRPWGGDLLHAPAAAAWALARWQGLDRQVLRAVATHPTGGSQSGALALVLIVADYCEPLRRFPGAAELRRELPGLALATAAARVMREKTERVARGGGRVHPLAATA